MRANAANWLRFSRHVGPRVQVSDVIFWLAVHHER
jgi:hypothetical protein